MQSCGHWASLDRPFLIDRTTAFHSLKQRKDLHLLCTLANFEAYMVPQACIAKLKTPKPFAFALKSVEKMTFFENADQDVSGQGGLNGIVDRTFADWTCIPCPLYSPVHPLFQRQD